ncbi:BMP family lipoprotein [Fretibacterium sp. OH1220_COT-178]|uniref:BMP family lipoprotein n=1 Tax=Fretibacterium sp. OH1220_COT-178 TaxID=2491047 RepID=UPI000F5DA546|nr:BMP family protein [Fretibacterium sp. OH1220_COT-178]RRD64518.1 BMP family ABC transporter substrate-binding protein [Fretibacterium sp. OH1220_COT-178]
MKKRLSLLVLALLLVVLGASAARSEPIKVGFVVPSTRDDLAWSQAMYEGIVAVQQELGEGKLELSISERLGNPVDAAAAIRQYASQGYDIIIAHGAQYQSLLNDIAPDFPKTSFAYGTGYAAKFPNIFAYDPHAQEGAYLGGVIAGMMTKSGVIGLVGPVEAGDAIKYNKGFEMGVKAVNPKAVVRIAYTGSFNDLVGAGEIARTAIKAGADFLSGSSQQSVGALKAVAEHKGVHWISTDLNMKDVAPDSVLMAQVYLFKNVVKEIIDSRAKGELGGRAIPLSLANGNIDIQVNHELPPEVAKKLEEVKADIASGKLKIELK